MIHGMKNIGIAVPEVLLPNPEVDLEKWAVVACDQYTSEPEYWAEVEKFTGDSPSTLHMIFPEVYLGKGNEQERINKINNTMKEYLERNVLVPQKRGFVYVDREISHSKSRKGLIMLIDLEHYDYNRGSGTLVRATEGTILDRLPPRVKIRENAVIESPHIMLLIDDPEMTVIEPIAAQADKFEKLYDFDLMKNGGHIRGYLVSDDKYIESICKALAKLADKKTFQDKYGLGNDSKVLLFAAGDGNHSLATAKVCWENLKKSISESEYETHPARYALVEVVNIHDEGLIFEPIHRVLFNVSTDKFLCDIVDYFNNKPSSKCCITDSRKAAGENIHSIEFISGKKCGFFEIENSGFNLEVAALQDFLDKYLKDNPGITIDYIHGAESLKKLCWGDNNIGFLLQPMKKSDLFKTVILDGSLPKKTFSMGEAEEKRYYLECRKIR